MKILITNDDGVFAPGIVQLAEELCKEHEVVVVAPSVNNSAVSHKVNLRVAFAVNKLDKPSKAIYYAVDGSPVDCVNFALGALGFQPDFLISGINDGMNIGSDVMYSGTVAAAMEGGFLGVPSLAVSVFNGPVLRDSQRAKEFSLPVKYVKENLPRFLAMMGEYKVLNINVPMDRPIVGEKACRLARCVYTIEYSYDEEGRYHRHGIPTNFNEVAEGTDLYYIQQGYVTLTPITCDFTDLTALKGITV